MSIHCWLSIGSHWSHQNHVTTRSGHADLTGARAKGCPRIPWGNVNGICLGMDVMVSISSGWKLPHPLEMKWTSSQIQDFFLQLPRWFMYIGFALRKILSTVMVLGCFRTLTNGGFPISMLVFRKFSLISVPNSLVKSRASWTCFQVGEWLVSEYSFSS